MGVDICYFLDHDLPTDSPQKLYEELKKRIPDKEIILHNKETVPFYKKDVWYILPCESNQEISLHYENEIFSLHLEIYKNVVEVREIKKDDKPAFDYLRWYQMITFFMNKEINGLQWFENMIDTLNNTLVSIFHSKQLLLTADSSSIRHETLYGEFLMEQGKTIEEALEMNKSFSPPCKVLRNEEAFGRSEIDYKGNGDDWVGPFFIFDVDQNINLKYSNPM